MMLNQLFPEHLTQLLPPFNGPLDLFPRYNSARDGMTIQIRLLYNGEKIYQDRVHKCRGSLLVIAWNPEPREFCALDCHSVDTYPGPGFVSSLRALRDYERNGQHIERDLDWEPKTVAEYVATVKEYSKPPWGPVKPA